MKIAIIGSGISGLGAAYLLNKDHDITLYEKNCYIGGHARTINIDIGGKNVPVDTGFIVFNKRNYPNLTGLFNHLDVDINKSDMSFGISINNGYLEYGTRRIFDLFAQKSNLIRFSFWNMLKDILKFNKYAANYIDSDLTLGEVIKELKLSNWFKDYYLLAMGASIWSTPSSGMLDFPASSFIRFFDNHGLLTVNDQPQWYTVKGGSKEYVSKIIEPFKTNIKLNTSICKVIRNDDGVEIIEEEGNSVIYDQIIIATHSDQAISMIENPTKEEKEIIGSIKYQPNEMILHSDISFMQKRKNAWSSWVYLSEEMEDNSNNVSLSYWMNNLQNIDTNKDIIITLNPKRKPDIDKIYDTYVFHHPVFDINAIKAQKRLNEIQGKNNIWFAGAWQRYGFHEDGLLSAVNIAEKMGVNIPWK